MSTYGDRLKNERLRLKLTQAQLADAGGVGRHAQSCYERDITLPRADYLAAITLQGIDTVYIITGRRTLPVSLSALLNGDFSD
ncbi:transcriptional regulator [Pseudomonas fragi]|uniref:Transcriptional regulator n=1 Tax=Pseudomonas fragi TaxID=296 RepID=A0A266LWM0_PSEFR|nr:transcriptional regulator [Pseudomonas fragi]OZY42486.1 transcriptional regulator [Pseudomonas fragi]